MTRALRPRSGAVLLEALIALFILASVGIAAVMLSSTATRGMALARDREEELRAASAFMDDVALWSPDDLNRHLGSRAEGRWRLTVGRTQPSLYSVQLADTTTGAILLDTFLYRPTMEVASGE